MKNKMELEFIDENKILPKLLVAIKLKHNIGLRGATGTGKTSMVRELAKQYQKELVTLNMTVHASTDEIKGKYIVKPNKEGKAEVTWIKGIVADAMESGKWICIEEANFMNEELASVFYSIMDDRRELVLDEHENEVITAHEDFRMFLTMNWDYKGTIRFNPAIMNRVNSWFDLNYLKPANEIKLITARTNLPEETAKKIVDFAKRVRGISEEEGLVDLSTRALLHWAMMIKEGIEPLDAAEVTVIPVLAYDDGGKKKLRDTLHLSFGKA